MLPKLTWPPQTDIEELAETVHGKPSGRKWNANTFKDATEDELQGLVSQFENSEIFEHV